MTIDFSRRKVGEVLYLTTKKYLYRLTVRDPENSLVNVESGDKQFYSQRVYQVVSAIQPGEGLILRSSRKKLHGIPEIKSLMVAGDGWEFKVW